MHRTNTTARLFIDFKQWRTPGQRLFAKCHFTVCHRNAPFSKCKRKGCRKPAALESKSERRQKRSTCKLRIFHSLSELIGWPFLIIIHIQPDSITIIFSTYPTPSLPELALRVSSMHMSCYEVTSLYSPPRCHSVFKMNHALSCLTLS